MASKKRASASSASTAPAPRAPRRRRRAARRRASRRPSRPSRSARLCHRRRAPRPRAREARTHHRERRRCGGRSLQGSAGRPPMLFAILPIAKVEPTPFQRDLSDAHHKRLAESSQDRALPRSRHRHHRARQGGRLLDPQRSPSPGRDAATRAKAITALVVPTREVAWQISRSTREGAQPQGAFTRGHSHLSRSPRRGRLAARGGLRVLPRGPGARDAGRLLREEPRFAGGAYHPVLRRVETFSDEPIGKAMATHEKLAALTSRSRRRWPQRSPSCARRA